MNNNLIYDVNEKPPMGKNLLFALQQLLSIIAATMLVPVVVDKTGIYLSQSSALIGAGVGTIVYLLITRFKSPVFLGSSFAFVTPLTTAVAFGYFGIVLGAIFAGLVYVIIALIVKFAGTEWINKIMPPIIIGPVVALIGFDLAGSAVNNVVSNGVKGGYNLVSILIGIITFLSVVLISAKGSKKIKMYPFVLGILLGYILAVILTLIGNWTSCTYLQIIDFTPLKKIGDFKNWIPNITIIGAIKEGTAKFDSFADVLTIFIAFVPIALVSFAEHIADHKNISSIINKDLLKDPGLDKTLLGDGIGSMAGAFMGGCPNTTYGESIGCVALSKNASTRTILTAAIMSIVIAFIYPVIAFFETIPSCVIGGVSIALYGFISVSGLRMIKDIDLNETKNLFVVASIFICGIGGLKLNFGSVVISNIACALVICIVINLCLSTKRKKAVISENSSLLESDEIITDNETQNKEWLDDDTNKGK